MSKPAKPAPAAAATEAPAKPKSKKLLLAVIGVLILGIAGGAGWYFTKNSKHTDEPKAAAATEPPTFLMLDPFTVNLQKEETDQFLQISITLKVTNMELADKVRQHLPEVRSRLLFLLSSKRASELIPLDGKQKLAREIIAETNSILGLKPAAPKAVAHESSAASNAETAPSGVAAAEAKPETKPEAAHGGEADNGVLEVLFTSFIIQ